MEIVGTLSRIIWRDRRFAVVEVTVEDGSLLRASGRLGSLVVGMPVAFEATLRGGPDDRIYGEEWKVNVVGEAPVLWRRLAGLSTLYDALPVKERASLATELTSLRWAAEHSEAYDLPASALWRAAECMGVADLDWLVVDSRARFGPDGPVVVVSNPASMVGLGVLEPVEALRLASAGPEGGLDQRGRVEGAVGVLRRYLLRNGKASVPSRSAARLVGEAFGVELEDLAGEIVTGVGGALAPTEAVEAAKAIWDACELRTAPPVPAQSIRAVRELDDDAAIVAAGVASSPVSLVVSPSGADGKFLAALIAGFGAGEVSVWHADRRGSLISRWPGERVEGASLVVLCDVHRLSAEELAGRLGEIDERSRIILVGDDWLWSPGGIGGVFSDLVASRRWPCHHLTGSGLAWSFRKGANISKHPALHLEAPVTVSKIRESRICRLRYDEPGGLVVRAGAAVMLLESLGGYGPGTIGTLVKTKDGLGLEVGHRQVSLGAGSLGRLASADYIAFGWLPGVSIEGLWLTRRVRSRQGLYAAMSAAKELWVDSDEFLYNLSDEPIRGPNPQYRGSL